MSQAFQFCWKVASLQPWRDRVTIFLFLVGLHTMESIVWWPTRERKILPIDCFWPMAYYWMAWSPQCRLDTFRLYEVHSIWMYLISQYQSIERSGIWRNKKFHSLLQTTCTQRWKDFFSSKVNVLFCSKQSHRWNHCVTLFLKVYPERNGQTKQTEDTDEFIVEGNVRVSLTCNVSSMMGGTKW